MELVIPSRRKLASVVDGQHRLWAFDYIKNGTRSNMPLVCSVFLDLPLPYQAYLFATVNFNQKKVDRSLAYELWGFDTEEEPPDAWTPEKTAVFLTRRLNVDERSPLKSHVIVAPQDDERLTGGRSDVAWSVSTATVVDGMLRLFSQNPTKDRAVMYQRPRSRRSRRDLPDDGTPARETATIVHGKGDKMRIVPIGQYASYFIGQYLANGRRHMLKGRKEDPGVLFLSQRGNHFDRSSLNKCVLRQVSGYTFRHSVASHLLANDVDVTYIAKLLGHESLRTTQRYLRLEISDLKRMHGLFHPRERGDAPSAPTA